MLGKKEDVVQTLELMDDVDDYTKKRIRVYRITRQSGAMDYQMIIVDPYMTINIDLSEQQVINLSQALKQI